jgi:hypothetical protein
MLLLCKLNHSLLRVLELISAETDSISSKLIEIAIGGPMMCGLGS